MTWVGLPRARPHQVQLHEHQPRTQFGFNVIIGWNFTETDVPIEAVRLMLKRAGIQPHVPIPHVACLLYEAGDQRLSKALATGLMRYEHALEFTGRIAEISNTHCAAGTRAEKAQ